MLIWGRFRKRKEIGPNFKRFPKFSPPTYMVALNFWASYITILDGHGPLFKTFRYWTKVMNLSVWIEFCFSTPIVKRCNINLFQYVDSLTKPYNTKEDKYNPLVGVIRAQGWNIRPLIVIITGVRGAIHTRSIELLENLYIPTSLIKKQ